MKYTKPMIVSTAPASLLIQTSLLKPGDSPDGGEGTNSSYRCDE